MGHGYIVMAFDGNCFTCLSGSGRFVKTKKLAWKYESREEAQIVAHSFEVLEDPLSPCATYYVKKYEGR